MTKPGTERAQAQEVLFPELAPPPRRALPVLQRRGDAVFYQLETKRIAAIGTGIMASSLTVNPYVGCEMSCAYCYAPYAHDWLFQRFRAAGRVPADEHAPTAFDRAIFVKHGAEEVTDAVLRHPDAPVVFGTATDPYQPAERRFRVTRAALEGLARLEGIDLSITTKSPLVVRDLDLLARIGARSRLQVNLSLISTDAKLLRVLEPRAPTPARRLEALRRLREAGIRAGLFAMPLLPGLTDSEEDLDSLFSAAREADACYVVTGGVRLPALSWRRFLPALLRLRPDLSRAYERIIRDRKSPLRARYREQLAARIARVRARHAMPAGTAAEEPAPRIEPQLSLL